MNVHEPEGRIVDWEVRGVTGSGLADVEYPKRTCAVVRSEAGRH